MMYPSGNGTLVLRQVPLTSPFLFLLLPIFVSTQHEQRSHTHTNEHSSTSFHHKSVSIRDHSRAPDWSETCLLRAGAWRTYTLVSTNHHFLNPCGTTGRRCASHTSCTPVGNPPPASVNTRHCPPLTSGCDFQLASLM